MKPFSEEERQALYKKKRVKTFIRKRRENGKTPSVPPAKRLKRAIVAHEEVTLHRDTYRGRPQDLITWIVYEVWIDGKEVALFRVRTSPRIGSGDRLFGEVFRRITLRKAVRALGA